MYPHWVKQPESEADWFQALTDLARYLRGPEGCPWDRDQHSIDFARYEKEEAQELIEAMEKGDASHIEEEWGDTIFVLLAAAAAAEEEGIFNVQDALRRAHEKMIRRHEHVFGGEKAKSAEDAIARWAAIKAAEKASKKP